MSRFTSLDIKFMTMALRKASAGVLRGQTPFGACIVRRGKIVSLEHNGVWSTQDITAHAEIRAIRSACRKLKSVSLKECVIYSTCEPCPMCMSACHWAGLKKVLFGASIADAQKAGFRELSISAARVKKLGKSPVKIRAGLMRKENRAFLKAWSRSKNKKVY